MKSSQIMEGRFDEYIINNIYTTIKMIILCIFYLVVLIAAYQNEGYKIRTTALYATPKKNIFTLCPQKQNFSYEKRVKEGKEKYLKKKKEKKRSNVRKKTH